jgi:micrococcal nuclease
MRHWASILLLAVVAVGFALRSGADGAGGGATTRDARIERVVDGDTIVARIGPAGTREHVRLIGVDTPETVKPRTPVQCFGKAASAFTKRMLPRGTSVRLERDAEDRDRYGRVLAYVRRSRDGLFVNAELARQGYANVMTIPPNVRYAKRFVALAREARARDRGLWRAC